jgi:hypothetical protein
VKYPPASWLTLALGLALFPWPSAAWAHSPTFAVYSKYEATAHGREVAFVFALDKAATLLLLEQRAAYAKVEPAAVEQYRDFFSRYLFERFAVWNDTVACTHPERLGRFFWDAPTGRMLAVTKFQCAAPLHELVIRSQLTHDMPTSHELVGDLQYGRALVRSYFVGDANEAHIVVDKLPQTSRTLGAPPRTRGKVAFVPPPDRVRRYEALAAAELGVSVAALGDGATNGRRRLFLYGLALLLLLVAGGGWGWTRRRRRRRPDVIAET